MATFLSEKRKNDEPRRFRWWVLVLTGFAAGVFFTMAFSQGMQWSRTHALLNLSDGIEQSLSSGESITIDTGNQVMIIDPHYATATAIIQEATQQAGNPPGSS